MKTFLNLIPAVSRDTTHSLSLAVFSFMIYLSNFRTIGAGDTVPASLLPIILLTEGSIYFDSYAQHYEKNGNPAYFFHHTRGRTVSSYPLAAGFLATSIYAIPVAPSPKGRTDLRYAESPFPFRKRRKANKTGSRQHPSLSQPTTFPESIKQAQLFSEAKTNLNTIKSLLAAN